VSGQQPGTAAARQATGPSVTRLWPALASYYTGAGRGDRRRYRLAGVLFASGVFHLGVQAVVGGPWDGPVSWRKPATFGLAFGLTLATLTWVTTFVPLRARLRGRVLTAFAAACVVEVTVITVQAWRGVPSHFNTSTPVNAALAFAAAAGGAVIIGTSLVFTAAATRTDPAVPASMRLAVRAGFAAFLVGLGIGAFMIFLGSWARVVSPATTYTITAAFKPGHAATMQGILILPALAWLASFTDWTEAARVRAVVLACAGYLLTAGVVVADTFLEIRPLALFTAPPANSLLAGAGLVALLTVAGWIVCRLVHSRTGPGLECR
jgi:hypothetical protein